MTTQQEDRQYVFDVALAHIREQGEPCVVTNSERSVACAYKSTDGKSCAFAPFIKEYGEELEMTSAESLVARTPERIDGRAVASGSDFCQRIQRCHDCPSMSTTFLADYERNMSKLASKYDLSYTPPEEKHNDN